jgi:hypothetical protein
MMDAPDEAFTPTPTGFEKIAPVTRKVGRIEVKRASWQDLFLENAQKEQGS